MTTTHAIQLVARGPRVVREEGNIASQELVPFVRYVLRRDEEYVDDARLFPAARANARELTVQYEADHRDPFWVAKGPHVHAIFATTSMLSVLYDIAGPRPIVAMPTTELLLVAKASADPRHILEAATHAYAEADDDARLSPMLYALQKDILAPLHLPAEHPLADAVARAHRRLAFDVYNEQKDHYEDNFDELDPIEEAFWASMLDVSGEDKARNWSASVWSEGLDTLLPETELVIFKPESGTPIVVRWEDVFAVLGPDAPPAFDAVDPPRYRAMASRWPSPDQLAALRAASISI